MAIQDSQPIQDAPAVQRATDAVVAPPSPDGPPGFEVEPDFDALWCQQELEELGAALAEAFPDSPPRSPQGAPGFDEAPQQGALVEAPQPDAPAPPLSPEGPPGFWFPPQEGKAASQVPPPSQQHSAPAMMPGPLLPPPTPAQALQPSQGTASHTPPIMQMQQAQGGHRIAPPPQPLAPPPPPMNMMQASQTMGVGSSMPLQGPANWTLQPSQGTGSQPPVIPQMMQMQQALGEHMIAPQPLPFGPLSMMMLPQQPQANPVLMEQPPQPFGPPSLMQQPSFAGPSCKRQRYDEYDMTCGQHMMGNQQEMAPFSATSFGPFLPNRQPCPPPNASSTLFVDGLPSNCSAREVAHIFRQYMGFRDVRLVNKFDRPSPMCFVDFASPAQAFFAMGNLQDYKFDLKDNRSPRLMVRFSHSPRVPLPPNPNGGS